MSAAGMKPPPIWRSSDDNGQFVEESIKDQICFYKLKTNLIFLIRGSDPCALHHDARTESHSIS